MGCCCVKDEEQLEKEQKENEEAEAARLAKAQKKQDKKKAKEANVFNVPRGTQINVDEEGKVTKSAYKVPNVGIEGPQPAADEAAQSLVTASLMAQQTKSNEARASQQVTGFQPSFANTDVLLSKQIAATATGATDSGQIAQSFAPDSFAPTNMPNQQMRQSDDVKGFATTFGDQPAPLMQSPNAYAESRMEAASFALGGENQQTAASAEQNGDYNQL